MPTFLQNIDVRQMVLKFLLIQKISKELLNILLILLLIVAKIFAKNRHISLPPHKWCYTVFFLQNFATTYSKILLILIILIIANCCQKFLCKKPTLTSGASFSHVIGQAILAIIMMTPRLAFLSLVGISSPSSEPPKK